MESAPGFPAPGLGMEKSAITHRIAPKISGVHYPLLDLGIAGEYLVLQAEELGLGTCWIGLGKFIQDPELRLLIGLPDDCRIVAPILIGYSKIVPDVPERLEPRILKIVS